MLLLLFSFIFFRVKACLCRAHLVLNLSSAALTHLLIHLSTTLTRLDVLNFTIVAFSFAYSLLLAFYSFHILISCSTLCKRTLNVWFVFCFFYKVIYNLYIYCTITLLLLCYCFWELHRHVHFLQMSLTQLILYTLGEQESVIK